MEQHYLDVAWEQHIVRKHPPDWDGYSNAINEWLKEDYDPAVLGYKNLFVLQARILVNSFKWSWIVWAFGWLWAWAVIGYSLYMMLASIS